MEDCGNYTSARGGRPSLRNVNVVSSISVAFNDIIRRRVIKDLILIRFLRIQINSRRDDRNEQRFDANSTRK